MSDMARRADSVEVFDHSGPLCLIFLDDELVRTPIDGFDNCCAPLKSMLQVHFEAGNGDGFVDMTFEMRCD